MRRSWVVAGLLVSMALACESKREQTKETPQDAGASEASSSDAEVAVTDAGNDAGRSRIKYLDGPKPTAETPIATWKDLTITVGDFDHATQLGKLFAPNAKLGEPFPEIEPERMAMPTVHFTTTRALVSRSVVRESVERLGIEVSDEEALAALRSNPTLVKWVDALGTEQLHKSLATIGLTEKDLISLGWEFAARKKLEDHLVEGIAAEDVWMSYAFETTTVRLLVAMGTNVPSSKDLTAFVESHGSEIAAYYEANKRDFRVPKRARIDMVRAPDGTEVDKATLEKAAKLLERKPAVEVAKELGLEAFEGQFVVSEELPRALSGKIGDTGFSLKSPRGALAWKLRGTYASHFPELDRGLRRQVGAEMMRRQHLVPSLEENLEKARKILLKVKGKAPESAAVAKAKKAIEALGLEFSITEPFPRLPNGSVPGFGLAEEVAEAAFSLTEKKRTSKPILSRERGFVIHLVARTKPDRQDFEDRKALLLEAFRKDARPTIIDRYIQAATTGPDGLEMDLQPLGRKYGILKK